MPVLEREVIERWREEQTEARYLARNAGSELRYSFLDGPIPRTTRWACIMPGAGPTRTSTSATTPCSASGSGTRTGSTARGFGSRSRSRRSWASRTSEISRTTGSTASWSSASPGSTFAEQTRAEQAARLVDGLGAQLLHEQRREQLRDLGFLKECQERGLSIGSRRHALVPALRDRPLEHGDRDRGLSRASHLSLTIRLPISTAGHEGESLLVWTTTPWTLSSNVAAAVHPDLTYELVEGTDDDRWWVSRGSSIVSRRKPQSSGRRAGPTCSA